MKISALFILGSLTCLGATASAATPPSAQAPPGSYRLSCYSATVTGNTLSAQCQNLAGSYRQSTLTPLDACENAILKGGDITNADGSLVCVPNLPQVVAGESFPQSETTINRWVYGADTSAMTQHSWAIWAGLTHFTGTVNGVPVRAYETWATPNNMIYRIQSGIGFDAVRGQTLLTKQQLLLPRGRFELGRPNQFRNLKPKLRAASAVPDGDTHIFVAVAYNPAAAQHAIINKLFLQSTLNGYLKQGYTQIPVFPNSSITIKPVYKIILKNQPSPYVKNGVYTMPGWPGTPSPAVAYPEADWNACVYIDLKGSGPSGSSIDQGCKGQSAASTFHLSDFISHTITAAEAPGIAGQTGLKVSPGDIAILVGMHVTTRETTRWAWQTFWWSANPDQPYTPSSGAIAAAASSGAGRTVAPLCDGHGLPDGGSGAADHRR